MILLRLIFAVLFASALLGLMAWQVLKQGERSERDPKYRRRQLYVGAAIYALPVITLPIEVALRTEPAWMLLGLPIPMGIAWWYIGAARQVKVT